METWVDFFFFFAFPHKKLFIIAVPAGLLKYSLTDLFTGFSLYFNSVSQTCGYTSYFGNWIVQNKSQIQYI